MGEWEDLDQFQRWRDKYGWAGTVFVRDDVEVVFRQLVQDESVELPDWLWERIRETWCWRKGIIEGMLDASWPILEMAVHEALDDFLRGNLREIR